MRFPSEFRALVRRFPVLHGTLNGLGSGLALLLAMALITFSVPVPSPRLFENAAQIGATLVIAFAVEVTWLVNKSHPRGGPPEEWVVFVSFLGLMGLSGVGISLALVEHLIAGHENWLDRLGFAWVLASLLLLGAIVALQPATVHVWRQEERLTNDPPLG